MTPVEALQMSAVARWVKQGAGVYPTLEVVHIIGFAILTGALVVHHARVLGWNRSVPVGQVAKLCLPWVLASLLLIVPTGFLMFVGAAGDLIANRAFIWKVGLMMAAGTNAGIYHMAYRETQGEPWVFAKLQAFISLVLWFGVIGAGRFIAYT
jgi:hypothetical protein